MNLEKLFESLDDKVFTAELKESLEAQFNEAVEVKTALVVEAEISKLSEKSEAHIDFLSEKAEEYIETKQEELLENVDKYLERVVEEFVESSKETLAESVKSEKADALIEAFETMLVTAGVEVSEIVEAKAEKSDEIALKESIDKYDGVVNELIELKEENESLIRQGVINEVKEGLSLVESEKFEKLAGLVEFTRDDEFLNKLTTMKESVIGAKETKIVENEETPSTKKDWERFV